MRAHRHKFVVTRRTRAGGHPLVKRCECGRTWRWHRGRWTLLADGRADEYGFTREEQA